MQNTKNIINNIVENNLVDAKRQIKEQLLNKLGTILESKIEEIAPSMIAISESEDERKKDVTRKMAMGDENGEDGEEKMKPSQKSKKQKNKNIKDDVQHDDVELEDEFDDDFEQFVDQIHEIVEQIENEIGKELSKEEIIEISNDYINFLNEETEEDSEEDSEDEDEDEDMIEEEKDLPGNQEAIDVAQPKGKITGADFKKLRSMRGKK